MNTQDVWDPQRWAETTFGGVLLHDLRRTRRAVTAATHIAKDASTSRPSQMQRRKKVKAVYRLLDEPGRGLLLQTVLAIDPATHHRLRCAHQEPFMRQSAPKGQTRAQRRKRSKETDVWGRCVQAIGPSCSSTLFVHVADRGADIFAFLDSCRRTQTHFVVCATQDRRVQMEEETLSHLLAELSVLPAVDARPFDVPASHGRQARSTTLHLAWTHLSLLPPRHDPRLHKLAPIPVWV